MLLNNVVYATLAHSMAANAAIMMVQVAQNNLFQFTPNSVTAAPGDVVQFNFASQNHSVASSTANRPCQPEANAINSDFQPIAAAGGGGRGGAAAAAAGGKKAGGAKGVAALLGARQAQTAANPTPQFSVPVTDTQPIYIYCPQAQHCQQGMVMVINPPNDAAVVQYAAKAANANNNVPPKGGLNGGTMVNDAAGTTPRTILGATAGDAAPVNQGGKAPVKGAANAPAAAAKGKAGGGAGGIAALLGGAKGN